MGRAEALNDREVKIGLQQHLLELIIEVAEEEGFEIEHLDAKYNPYYVPSTENGHRCVDGRSILETYEDGSSTGYENKDYLGSQFPGGTLGILGATRVLARLDEIEARRIVKQVCDNNKIRMGAHLDDAHGRIRTADKLAERTEGCGNQDAAADGKIPMYAGLVDRATIDSRFAWVKSNNGRVPVLTGEHEENLAAANLEAGKTFDISRAVGNEESIFNMDLAAAYELGGLVFDELATAGIQHAGPFERQGFQAALAKTVVRDYLQTLLALGCENKLYIHADPQVQV